MPSITCPFCLQQHDTGAAATFTCPKYQETIPAPYIREHESTTPLWLVTVGFPKHGKTTYLAALTLTLQHMSGVWPGSFYRALDQYTMDAAREWMRAARLGIQNQATSRAIPRPLLLSMYKVPGVSGSGSRCLVMYDVAGEIYDRLHEVEEYVASIKQVSTTWFFVSLKDMREQDRTLSDLFTVYLTGLENLHADLRGRNLIVVYTKADEIAFPQDIRQYLINDRFQAVTMPDAERPNLSAFTMDDYFAEMETMSERLRAYTSERVPGGDPFISMVESQGMRLVFSVTSALGERPDAANRLREDARRYRILDPFLWAVRLERPAVTRRLALILDATRDARMLYQGEMLRDMWSQLNTKGGVTTYYLGNRRPASSAGQTPPLLQPGTARPRLIGPILEQLPAATTAVVLTAGPILDLDDYASQKWRDRLLLVGLDREPEQTWDHTLVQYADASTTSLIDALMRLQA